MDDAISRQAALDALNEQIEQCNKALGSFDISLKDEFAIKVERASLKAYREQLENLPPVQPKAYIKADYIMALHNEYGCTLTRAEEAHDKALEYLRNKAIVNG